MTTIVRHKRTGNNYVLLGINGEVNKVNPSRFLNDLFTQEKSEAAYSATVCDLQGNLFLVDIDDLVVIEIDGQKLTDILPKTTYQQPETDFADDENELEAEDFEDFTDNQDRETKSQASDQYAANPSNQQNLDDFDNDEDWI